MGWNCGREETSVSRFNINIRKYCDMPVVALDHSSSRLASTVTVAQTNYCDKHPIQTGLRNLHTCSSYMIMARRVSAADLHFCRFSRLSVNGNMYGCITRLHPCPLRVFMVSIMFRIFLSCTLYNLQRLAFLGDNVWEKYPSNHSSYARGWSAWDE